MKLEFGQFTAQHRHETDVLHDGSVDTRLGCRGDHRERIVHLARKHERVGREIDARTAQMRIVACRTQVVDSEVIGIAPRIE